MKQLVLHLWTLLIVLCILFSCAAAETVRGDLTARFSGSETLEYQDVTYRVKNRMSTMVFAIIDRQAAPEEAIWMLGVLSVDDTQKQIHPLFINPAMLIEESSCAVYTSFAQDESWELRCQRLVATLNTLFPHEVLDNYFVLDVQGVELLGGGDENLSPDTLKSRLKALKTTLETNSTSDLLGVYDFLGDYIETNMKSGALIRIGDKTQYYEVLPSVTLPVCERTDNIGRVYAYPDEDALLPLYITVFYEEKVW